MQEFRPMAVLHADLVGPLPERRNSRNQRDFQYVLSTVDSATCYLWLLPLHDKTAEAVAAALFDEVTSRVSVPSAMTVIKLSIKEMHFTHIVQENSQHVYIVNGLYLTSSSFYHVMYYSAKCGLEIACRLSVCDIGGS